MTVTIKSKPIYKHDCSECVFLGTFFGHDLYFCDKGLKTVIARFGNNGPEYYSGFGFSNASLVLAEEIAKNAGLI